MPTHKPGRSMLKAPRPATLWRFISPVSSHEKRYGISTLVPLFGSLSASRSTAMLHPPLPEMTWIYGIDREARVVRYEARSADFRVELPLDPMHGTVGVAPALGEVRSSLVPGDWGGNMDTPEMRTGTTCYLGVNTPGALFSFGDGHARQGEGKPAGWRWRRPWTRSWWST